MEPAAPGARPAAGQLHVAGLTGVDVGLPIAGPGSRSYAFLLDWQIRVLLALAWIAAALLLHGGGRGRFGAVMFVPALAIYLLYHPVLELLMRGRTPGKRMAGVRIVTRHGGTPGVLALLIRNVFRLVDALPSLYLLGLASCLLTAQHVRIGDLAAGTLLVLDAPGPSLASLGQAVGRSGLAPQAVELLEELLGRWPSLTAASRRELGSELLRRLDAQLTAEELAACSDQQLHERLRAWLAPGAEPAGER